MKYLIGVDLGTSATKTIIMDQEGRIAASASRSYPLYEPANGWAEQDPHDWRDAVMATIREVVCKAGVPAEDVAGIGLSGQMHGLVMLDKDAQVLSRSIIWCDARAKKQEDEMFRILPAEAWMEHTGNPPLAGWTAAKLLWVRENRPDLYAKCRHILLPKDYVRYELTGVFATDVSDASGMQMLDVKNRCWSKEVLKKLDVDEEMLAKVYESADITGYLRPKIAAELGLTTRTAVAAGGSDNACAALGTGVVQEGQAFTTIGTSAVVYTHLDHYTQIPGGGLHMCCCAVPGCWHTMGGPQSAGLSVEWFKNGFCQDLTAQAKAEGRSFYDLMNELAEKIPVGSDKLIYLPFLMGERTPHLQADYRGAFLGLNTVHTKAHMLRAIMEGIVYCLADCNELLRDQGVRVRTMRVCGGGSRSPLWRRMMADLYECDVRTLCQEEGPAYGGAVLAGAGTNVFSSVQDACSRFIKEKDRTLLNSEEAEIYKRYHRIYKRMYESLLDSYLKLAKVD